MYSNGVDVMEQTGLAHLNPSPLHCAAIQGRGCAENNLASFFIGDRSRLKMLAREVDDVDVRDMAGNTPLMYTVMGRQPKVYYYYVTNGKLVAVSTKSV